MSSTLERIKAANDIKQESITIPEWDNVVIMIKEPVRKVVTELTEKYLKLDQNTGVHLNGSDAEGFGNALLVAMLHDEEGNQIFESVLQAEQVLADKSVLVQKRLLQKCNELVNGPTEKSVETAEGNSDATLS